VQSLTSHGLDGISPDLGDSMPPRLLYGLRIRLFPTAIYPPLKYRPGDFETFINRCGHKSRLAQADRSASACTGWETITWLAASAE
jgi:hypothetical protein